MSALTALSGYGITLNIGGELDVLTDPDEPSVEGNNYFSLDKNETVEIMAHRGTWLLSLQPVISFSVDERLCLIFLMFSACSLKAFQKCCLSFVLFMNYFTHK